ncbi:MAG: tryptophan synthase subunit alpha [Gammaproteobacteria bacterium RBG_16_51_14]|nr:MAG: tryptophan synthase subunit alpha [Gammaproteobacteria bacterium RBG_16_51_14]
MSKINHCFTTLRQKARTALIPFITAGDPEPEMTVPLMHALVKGGADIIELGIPFSDPMADGPVIQRASERALVHGTSLRDVIAMVADFRKDNSETPVVLMGYLNPVEVMGYLPFADTSANAGVDGVLIVDLPPEEAGSLRVSLNQKDLDQIFLIAPNTSEERLDMICNLARGFLYYVSLKGITGSDRLDVDSVKEKLQRIRTRTDLPLGVGFGIKDARTAAQLGKISDAVIIGSALVERISAFNGKTDELPGVITIFLSSIRHALDAV